MNHDPSSMTSSTGWQALGHLPAGGTVLNLAYDHRKRLWAATPAGLFCQDNNAWRPVLRGVPFINAGTIFAVERSLFAAGMQGGLIRSVDGGESWYACGIDQTQAPITCLAASPNYSRDRVLLAGTLSDGILRSIDGGRYWQMANFGLRNFDIYALAAAPVWDWRETIFAATANGVYQSPNGGRAWRFCGLEGQAVLSLALSPDFALDQTAWAGCESGSLFRTEDGGRTWLESGLPQAFEFGALNCLLSGLPGELWLGTSLRGVIHSADYGRTWEVSAEELGSVFCLVRSADGLSAGLTDAGLAYSEDQGHTWKVDTGLSARRLAWLCMAGKDGPLLAAGPNSGLWLSADGGVQWRAIEPWPSNKEITALGAGLQGVWVGAADGLYLGLPGVGWRNVLAPNGVILSLAVHSDLALAGSSSGEIYASLDGETNWQTLPVPDLSGQVSAIAFSPAFEQDRTIYAAAINPQRREVYLWRIELPMGGAPRAQEVLSERTDWFAPHLDVQSARLEDVRLILGPDLLQGEAAGWRRSRVSNATAPLVALCVHRGQLLVSAGGQVITSDTEFTWQAISSQWMGVVDFLILEDGALLALSVEGALYWRA